MPTECEITVYVPSDTSVALMHALGDVTLETMEKTATQGLAFELESTLAWQALANQVKDVYQRHDHVVLRGLEPATDARALMAAISILGDGFLTYGKGQVVKLFAMSPWSRGLAHTGAEGFFIPTSTPVRHHRR